MAKDINFRVHLISILCFVLASCGGIDKKYCDALEQKALAPDVQDQLREWVIHNVTTRSYTYDEFLDGGGMWPGAFQLLTKDSFAYLGMGSGFQVRPVGPLTVDFQEGQGRKVASVFFGERSAKAFWFVCRTRPTLALIPSG